MKKVKKGFVYILANKKRTVLYITVLYIGVTSDLQKRLLEHIRGKGSAFTRKYNAKHLLYFEEYNLITDAIEREKQLKNWKRDWKLKLIRKMNPHLRDLKNEIQFL